jgi:ribonuclease R
MNKHHHTHKKRLPPIEGTIRINTKGVGYVDIPDTDESIEIAPEHLNTALHRDTVHTTLMPGKTRWGNKRGEVVEVLERAQTRFVGTLEEEGGFIFLRPDDYRCYVDFIVSREDEARAKEHLGEKALVELARWSSPTKTPLARLLDTFGPAGEHETEMKSIVANKGFDWHFPHEVMQEAEAIVAKQKAFFAQEIPRRKDMRGIPTFTIDPDDAKDFDDAISVCKLENGHIELGVHIADVSAYLSEGSAMDEEAQRRATSIYLVDRTIPMLPEALSNNLCSLVPNEDRLAMSAMFEISMEGDVYERWFGETIINSDRRFTYKGAQDILTAGRGELFSELLTADTIARNLREARFRNGSIGFETDEIKFELDEFGVPLKAFRKERIDTMLMIEDLMLLANREVATVMGEFIKKKNGVFVWRIHDTPKPEKIEELALLLKALGYELKHNNGMVEAKAINALFAELEGAPEQDMIETAAIRSMAKAIYSTKNIGHFGLAFDYYTHFTSPIRRYPDVLVHRLVKKMGEGNAVPTQHYGKYERLCAECTEREISAAEAERDSIKLKQVEYLQSKIGETFSGVITGITDWGMFVSENETMAEGLVPMRTMNDDYYELVDHGFRLKGQKHGTTYSLGDAVQVVLKNVDTERKQIDWEVVRT